MAEPIVIKIRLDSGDLSQSKGEIRKAIKSALDAVVPDAREIGRKMGDALAGGMAEGLAKARQLRNQIEQTFNPAQRHSKEQAAEARHQQKLVELEQRKQAQISVIRARAEADAEKSARRITEAQEKAFNRSKPPDSLIGFFKRYSSTLREAGESIQQAGFGLAALTGGILELGRRAVASAVDIDRQVNVLKSLTGSAEAAEKRYAQLVATAQKTPGLTASLAATLDAQLRVANVTEATINRILPSIGKLNAVSPLGDPQKFAQNLVQLVTQGFERTDLKELVGQSPLAGEIIKSIFNVDNATNAKAIRESAAKLGINSTDAFFAAFAEAARNNPKLANVTESIGAQFDKLLDRVNVALRPLGLAIVQALTPLVEKAIPIIEQLSAAFSSLSPTAQQAILIFAGLAAAIAPLTIALGALIQTFGAIGNIFTVLSALFASGGALAGASAAVAGFAAAIPPVGIAAGALAVVIGGLVAANQLFATSTADAAKATRENLIASQERVTVGQKEIDSLRNLQEQASLNRAEQERIEKIYSALTPVQRERVNLYAEEAGGAETLTGKLSGLVELLDQENQKRREKLQLEASDTGKDLINKINLTVANLQAQQNAYERINVEIEGYVKKQAEAENANARFNSITGASFSVAESYRAKIAELTPALNSAQSATEKQEKELQQLALVFRQAAKASGQTTEEFIRQAIAASGLGGDLAALERRIRQFAAPSPSTAPSRSAIFQGALGLPAEVTGEGKPKPTGGGSGASSAESKARQLRDALLAQQKAFIEQNNRLLEDANKRELEQFRQLYEDKEITIREFYDAKLGLTQQNVGNEINALQQEISAQEKALSAAKAGTPEKIRLETELFKLRTELTLKTRELGDVEIRNLREFTKAATEEREKLLKETQSLALKLDESNLPTGGIAGEITPEQQRARQALLDSQRAATQFSVLDLELRQQELQIQNAINAGVLTEAQGKEATLALQRQYRDALIQSLEIQKQATIDPETINRLNVEIEQLRSLGQELTPLQALFKGFRSQAETLAESFERIGGAFKDKVLGVVDAGIDKLTSKLGFFKSLVGDILKSLTRVLLGNLFQPRGGGAGGGGGLGGFLGNLFGGGGGGGLGSFATGGFAGGGGAASILGGGGGGGGGGLLGSLSGLLGGGGGISAPPSATNPLGGLASIFRGGSGGGFSPIIQDSILGNQRLGGLGGLGNLLSGIGFGKTPGSGGALAGALPLLGISLGSQLGTDRLTSLIGGIGGGLLGVGLTAAPGIIGAGGALSGLGFLAPLFSNPFTAIAGAALLPLAFFLGRARQRRRDESASGDFLQEAIDNIREMRKRVESNELVLTITEARRQFEAEILEPFKAQINTLKTKSVRESRLKNQTADLKNLFEKEVIPAVQAQKNRQGINDKIIPEFAFGGIVPGRPTPGIDSVITRLSPGEMVLTQRHQAAIASVAGTGIFQAVGVPDAGQAQGDGSQAFAFGGVVSPARSIAPTINMTVQLMVSADEATNILNAAASTDDGQVILVNARKQASRNGLGRTRA